MRALLTIVVAMQVGCSQQMPPTAEVRVAVDSPQVQSLVALPGQCAYYDDGEACDATLEQSLPQIVAAELEFAGFRIVDSDKLVAQTRRRVETLVESGQSVWQTAEVTGATFIDLPPRDQKAILDSLPAQGVVVVRATVGGIRGWGNGIEHKVTLKAHDATGHFLWASRCRVLARIRSTGNKMLERLTRCALRRLLTKIAPGK